MAMLSRVPTRDSDDLAVAELGRLSDAWDAFFRAARRATGRAGRASQSALSLAQYHLVRPLGRGETRTVSRLATEAGVAQPTATRMLDHLERAGIVTRTPDASDRRIVLVQLTPDGEEALESKRRLVVRAREQVFADLSAAEQQQAASLLHRLADIVERL
jgi:MarR family transcriptional regulator, organic hydroperoxide resistance regulator